MIVHEFHDFTKSTAWQRAEALAVDIYLATDTRRWRQDIKLRGQLRDNAVSIAANIAEGAGSGTWPQYARFLRIAIGSATETQSRLSHARKVALLEPAVYNVLAAEAAAVSRMTKSLQRWVCAQHARARTLGD
ncbi:MAG: four helix bundle protein [Gemmatimonadaceae bacterium]|nr:four helix bundle protein [Gemmatimonadaceae bacterium]